MIITFDDFEHKGGHLLLVQMSEANASKMLLTLQLPEVIKM